MSLHNELQGLSAILDPMDGFWRQRLQPGLRLPQINQVLRDILPWRPSQEVIELYEWANGQTRGSMDLFPGHAFLPIDSALKRLRQLRRVHQPSPPVFPIFGGISLVTPLFQVNQPTSPVYLRTDQGFVRAYDSLASMFRTWREALNAGVVRWTGTGWQADLRRLESLRALINKDSWQGGLLEWGGEQVAGLSIAIHRPRDWPEEWLGFAPHFEEEMDDFEESMQPAVRMELAGAALADSLLKRYRQRFAINQEYLLVNHRNYQQLDLKWYDAVKADLEKQGFRMVADLEDVGATQNQPELLPTLVRMMSSSDRLSNVIVSQQKPRTANKLASLVLRRRAPTSVIFETHFSDMVVQTHCAAAPLGFELPPQILVELLPVDSALDAVWLHHQERVLRLRKDQPGLKPLMLRDFETIRTLHQREAVWAHEFATTRVPSISEIRYMGVADKDLERIHDLMVLADGRINREVGPP